MIPLASVSGPAFLAVVIVAAALFLWWLLRSDTRDEEDADEGHDVDQDRVSAP